MGQDAVTKATVQDDASAKLGTIRQAWLSLKDGLTETGNEASTTSDRLSSLEGRTSGLEVSTGKLGSTYKDLGSGISDVASKSAVLDGALNDAAGSIVETESTSRALNQTLQGTQTQTQGVSFSMSGLGPVLGGVTSSFRSLGGEAGAALGSVGQLMGGINGGVLGIGVATGAILSFASALNEMDENAVKSFADIEEGVASVRTLRPDLDTSEVEHQLESLSNKIHVSTKDLAEGLYNELSSIDLSQSDALKFLDQLSQGAVAARTNTETFGAAIIGVMNSYKLSVDDAEHVQDVFFNTVNKGVVNGQELATGLGKVTPAAKALGVSFDELGALIVGITKEGGNADENFTKLYNALNQLSKSSARDALHNLGIEMVDANGNFRDAIEHPDRAKGQD